MSRDITGTRSGAIFYGDRGVPLASASYGDRFDVVAGYRTDPLRMRMPSLSFLFLLPRMRASREPMPIVVGHATADRNTSDLLEGCECMNLDAAKAAALHQDLVDLAFSVRRVRWTDRRLAIDGRS